MPTATLYYVHDPMCSWCWGFRPVWQQVQQSLAGRVNILYVLGGLAPDNDLPMPAALQANIRDTWGCIQREIPGTQFNFDFWTDCSPRRSTYPACRAILAARLQGNNYDTKMLLAIQQAYYLQAKNPSEIQVLTRLASQVGLDSERFARDVSSAQCEQMLQQELALRRKLGVTSFPSLVLNCNDSNTLISIDYTSGETIVSSILECLPSCID